MADTRAIPETLSRTGRNRYQLMKLFVATLPYFQWRTKRMEAAP